jgi:hypothetical protein
MALAVLREQAALVVMAAMQFTLIMRIKQL